MARQRTTAPKTAVPWRWLLSIGMLAAGVRLWYFLQYRSSPLDGYHIVDQSYYLDWARRIAAGDWWGEQIFEQGPLYPYLLGLVFSLIGERLHVVLAAQLAIGVATVLLTSLCARRLFGATAGLFAGLATALYGPLVFYECMILKSLLEPALSVLAFYAVLRYREGLHQRWLWLCGLAIGAASLLRESHLLLAIPAAWGAAFPDAAAGRTWTLRPRLLSAGVLAAATLLPMLPSALRNYRVGGEWVWVTTGGGEVFYMGHGPQATGYYSPPDFITARPPLEHEDFRREAQRRAGRPLSRSESSRFWFQEGLRQIVAHPLRSSWLTIVKASVLLNDFEVPDSENYEVTREFIPLLRFLPSFGWLAGLGVLGLGLCMRSWRQHWLLIAFVAAYALPVLLLYNFGRFRIGLVPLWILLAAHGFDWLVRSWRSAEAASRRRAGLALLLVGLITVVAFLPPLGYQQMDYRTGSMLLRGTLARRAGDLNRAEQAFLEARQLAQQRFEAQGSPQGGRHPCVRKLAEAHLELASLYRSQDRLNEALQQYSQAIAVQSDSLEAHFNLANLLIESGHSAAAIEHYQRALAIKPRDVETLINLGGARLGEGQFSEAAQHLQEAVRIEPRNAKAHYNLANAWLLQGRSDLAIEHYGRSLESDPNNPDAHNNLGRAYGSQQRLTDAEAQFRKALAIDAQHANARLNLARILEAQGKTAAAATEYRRALPQFPPSSPQARDIEEHLRVLTGSEK